MRFGCSEDDGIFVVLSPPFDSEIQHARQPASTRSRVHRLRPRRDLTGVVQKLATTSVSWTTALARDVGDCFCAVGLWRRRLGHEIWLGEESVGEESEVSEFPLREIVDELRSAAEKWGFFQMVNHGIPKAALEGVLQGVRRFHELPNEEKSKWYDRKPTKAVKFFSNGYLQLSPAPADWRDTLTCYIEAGKTLDPKELPSVCRQEIVEYLKGIEGLKKLISEWLSEALGLSSDFLEKQNYMESELFVAHYYPACPEPDLTLGISKHSDPYMLTLLLQDNVGGLQVLHHDHWIDLPPLEGAIIANIGDLMQIISNDKFKSVEHRVLATKGVGSRISAACFFHPNSSTADNNNNYKLIGPAKELLSEQNPPKYREVHHGEYMAHWKSTRLDGRSGLPPFKL